MFSLILGVEALGLRWTCYNPRGPSLVLQDPAIDKLEEAAIDGGCAECACRVEKEIEYDDDVGVRVGGVIGFALTYQCHCDHQFLLN